MNVRCLLVLLIAFATPMFAQVEESALAPTPSTPSTEGSSTGIKESQTAPQAQPQLRIVSNAPTANFLPKYVDGAGGLSSSIISEVNGQIGIDTPSPLDKLHISGTSSLAIRMTHTDPNSAMNGLYFYEGATSLLGFINQRGTTFSGGARNFNMGNNDPLGDTNLYAGGSVRMRLAANGNVAIGNVTPLQKLHVFSSDDAGTMVQVENTSTGSSAYAAFRTTSALSLTSYIAHGNRDASLVRYGIPLAGWGEILNFTGNGFIVGTSANTPLVFGTNNAERMRILGNGNVGIGTVSPTQMLEVNGNVRSTPSTGSFSVGGVAPAVGYPFFATSAIAGVPAAMQLRSNYAGTSTSYFGNVGDYGTVLSYDREPSVGTFVDAAASPNQYKAVSLSIGDSIRGRLLSLANFPGGTETVRLMVDSNGEVLIGTTQSLIGKVLHVVGDAQFDGSVIGTNIRANYQDVAEWVPSAENLSPGTVVVIDKRSGNTVKASTASYDTSVAGVVSAQPGIILGEESASKEQVATTGRVRVRVDASRGSIEIGDLLVTSDISGTAMKSMPIDIGGFSIHRPGTIIGKALEPLDHGAGEILVLLSLQ